MIDLHNHIIPGVDDGADSVETSVKMLELAKKCGTKTIFATPHYYRGRFEAEYSDILNHLKSINGIVDGIEILPGQEIFIDRYTLKAYEEGKIGTLNGTRYMLLELPFTKLNTIELDIIYELRIKGIVPIIAHPERYSYIIQKPSNINSLIEEGCLFQINSGSIEGLLGKEIKSTAETLIQNGICSFIASDAHNANNRCPGLNRTYEYLNKKNPNIIQSIINNSKLLLNNEEIESKAFKIKDSKKLFDIFRK